MFQGIQGINTSAVNAPAFSGHSARQGSFLVPTAPSATTAGAGMGSYSGSGERAGGLLATTSAYSELQADLINTVAREIQHITDQDFSDLFSPQHITTEDLIVHLAQGDQQLKDSAFTQSVARTGSMLLDTSNTGGTDVLGGQAAASVSATGELSIGLTAVQIAESCKGQGEFT